MNSYTVENFMREIERFQSELSSSIASKIDDKEKNQKLKQLNKLTNILISLSDYKNNFIEQKNKSKK
jgi:hypothetical protein